MRKSAYRWALLGSTLGWVGNIYATTAIELGPEMQLEFGGYLRQSLSLNLEDHPELAADGRPIGGAGKLSMSRTSFVMQTRVRTDWMTFTGIGRWTREQSTSYLEDIEDRSGVDLQHRYEENELREAYIDFDLSDSTHLRLGKQQVVWGESDFFQAMDVIHGFDQTWRSVFEPNEDWRKPLILANVTQSFPSVGGSMQLIYRPGWDDDEDLGNSVDLFGGRWALQPNKGVNTLRVIPINLDHPRGDADDSSYGLRWSGLLSGVNYALAYYHTLNQEQVVNFINNPFGPRPRPGVGAGFAEFIFPEVDIFGVSANGFSQILGSAWRFEVAYYPEKPYNYGGLDTFAPFGPGSGGIKQKETAKIMFGLDRPIFKSFGSSPPVMQLQVFDTWIVNYDREDQLTEFNARRKEHAVIATAIFRASFKYDVIGTSIAILQDTTYGGGAVIPAVTYNPGNHWRFQLEADLFYKNMGQCSRQPGPGGVGNDCATLFGNFDNNDQLVFKVSYLY